MKIHYLISSLEDSEAIRALPAICKIFYELGHEISLYILSPPSDYLPHELRTSLLEGLTNIYCKHLFETKKNLFACCNAVTGILRRNPPDFLITSQKMATIAGQISGHFLNIPVVSWKHGTDDEKFFQTRQRFSRFWIADSSATRLYLQKKIKIPSDNIFTWPTYQPPRTLLWSAEKREYWRGTEALRLGFLASDHNKKSKTCLIKALSLLKKNHPNLSQEISLLIAYDPAASNYRRTLKKPGLSGRYSRNLAKLRDLHIEEIQGNLTTFYLHADILVQPAYTLEEPLHLYEAMTAGMPVITSPFPEMNRALNGGRNGTLLSKTSPALLAEAIHFYLKTPDLIRKKGQNAHSWIKMTYNRQNFVETGKEIIQKMEEILLAEKQQKLTSAVPSLTFNKN
ncbi:glycosyltransferase family 4 protein [Acetobacteraceae bacterium]|nr:glycosyltransferase family 4 protein [Acetobacteraceae bacterium]